MKLFLTCIVLMTSAWVAQPGVAWQQGPATVTRITGEQVQLNFDKITDGVLQGDSASISLNELMMIDTGRTVVPEKAAIKILMAAGGELAASAITFDGERFVIDVGFVQWTIPPDAIKGIVIDEDADLSRVNRAMTDRSVELDTLIAMTKDGQGLVRGLLLSITDSKVVMNHEGRSRSLSINRVVGIVPADLKPSQPDGSIGSVQLTNGSSLTGGIGNLAGNSLSVKLPGNAAIEIPFQQVASISLTSDRVAYLSDLEPVDVSSTPLATLDFNWQRDLSVRRNPLRLYSWEQGKTLQFAKGIGTHAASRLEFENAGGFNQFSAIVGIASETEGKGDCDVSVWADGIKLWEGEISGSTEPLKVVADISGMKRIALVVRNGRHLDLGDHVNWVDARFLKLDQ